MPMTEQQFKQYLALYGTELENWPAETRVAARRATYNPAFSALIAREKEFEERMDNRRFEPADPDLAERIIHTSARMKRSAPVSFTIGLKELLPMLLPRHPAFAAVAMLSLGIALGFMMPAPPAPASSTGDPITQVYFEESGVTL